MSHQDTRSRHHGTSQHIHGSQSTATNDHMQAGVMHDAAKFDRSSRHGGQSTACHADDPRFIDYYNRTLGHINRSKDQFESRPDMMKEIRRKSQERRFASPNVEIRHANAAESLISHRNEVDQLSSEQNRTYSDKSNPSYNPLKQSFINPATKKSLTVNDFIKPENTAQISIRSSPRYQEIGEQIPQSNADSNRRHVDPYFTVPKDQIPKNPQRDGLDTIKAGISDYGGRIEGNKVNLTANNDVNNYMNDPKTQYSSHLNTSGTQLYSNQHSESNRQESHVTVTPKDTPAPNKPPGATGGSFQDRRPENLHFSDVMNNYKRENTPSADSMTPKEAYMSPFDLGVRGIPNIGNSCYM